MTEPYEGPDRRSKPTLGDHWHLDKKVPITLIFAMLTQFGMGLWAVADMRKDIEVLKMQTSEQRERDKTQDVRLTEVIGQLRSDLKEVSSKLDRLVERAQK
jgi:hypothetical protein